MARATTAAIRVEKLASDSSESSTPDSKPDVRVETDSAIYEDGKVTLKGNPLKTTKEVLCPRCHLPRLLHPTDGKDARKPDPTVTYCKKHPYIDKPGYDIYGQTWVAPGPGRGKKKKDMKLDNGESPGTPTPDGNAKDRPPNVLSFPSATCSKCKRCILVTRLNNHMGSCIGNSGRNASRAAAQKISNGNGPSGSQHDGTPPSSQKGTPLPGSRAGSPRKRDGDEFDEDGEDSDAVSAVNQSQSQGKKNKKLKGTSAPAAATPAAGSPALSKKVILKQKAGAGGSFKKEKVKSGSLLSNEHKLNDAAGEVRKKSSVEVANTPPKKSTSKIPSPAKKLKLGAAKPPLSSPASKNGRDADAGSESSGTLSSPPR